MAPVKVALSVPLDLLRRTHVRVRSRARLESLRQFYAAGGNPPPIPLTVAKDGTVQLNGDGNHRLAAARAAGVPSVWVRIDRRNAHRLR